MRSAVIILHPSTCCTFNITARDPESDLRCPIQQYHLFHDKFDKLGLLETAFLLTILLSQIQLQCALLRRCCSSTEASQADLLSNCFALYTLEGLAAVPGCRVEKL